jgi:histone deacetylase complex subunit SAP18
VVERRGGERRGERQRRDDRNYNHNQRDAHRHQNHQ